MYSKRKHLVAILVVVIVGVIMGGFIVYRNFSLKPAQTVEQNTNIDTQQALTQAREQTTKDTSASPLQGKFVDADAIHSGSGTVVITKTNNGPALVFKEDFSVTAGPDLFVYLSPNAAGDPLGEFASLGKLERNQGEQVYSLPENYKDYKSVVIWCRAFGTKFSYANLN